jgi:MFS family permease
MAAALVPREMMSWSLTAIALGALEGALLGVIVKNQFAHVAGPAAINLAVAVVAGAPSFANLASFLFASRASGRDKVALLSRLMQVVGICILVMAIPGRTLSGLLVFCLFTVIGRMAWSGIVTIRAAIWRVNYERRWRGRVTARIVQLGSLLIATFSALTGYLLDWHEESYRPMFVLAAASAFLAAHVYSKTRVRRRRQLAAAEQASQAQLGRSFGPAKMLAVLKENREFRRYMGGMMVLGSGNLMVIAMLVIMISDTLNMSQLSQVMITSSIPLLMLCVSVVFWAPLLERRHIFSYRAVQSWSYVFAIATFALALIGGMPWLLWPGAVLMGTAIGGGHLGWNLGHNDFTDDANASLYMSIHVTLTGIRGLVMPLLGVLAYQYIESLAPGMGVWAMILPFSLSFVGTCWFVWLNYEMKSE